MKYETSAILSQQWHKEGNNLFRIQTCVCVCVLLRLQIIE